MGSSDDHMGPRLVGGSTAFYRLEPDGWLRRISMPTYSSDVEAAVKELEARPGSTQAIGGLQRALANAPKAHLAVHVTLHLASSGAIECTRVDVVTSVTAQSLEESLVREFDHHLMPITAAVWRQIAIGELIDDAIRSSQRTIRRLLASQELASDTREIYLRIAEAEKATRRGPKTRLTAQVLREVVAPAYLAGGSRRRLQSVQDALAEAGYAGTGPSGEITPDQARRAIYKARKLGLVPAAQARGGVSSD